MHWHSGVYHSPGGIYLQQDGDRLTLRLRTPAESPVLKVYLRFSPDGEDQTEPAEASAERPGYRCRWWQVRVVARNPRFHYRFMLMTAQGLWWYSAAGLDRAMPTDQTDFVILADRPQKSWLDRSVFYQIFPDRFAQGEPANRVRTGEHTLDGKPVVARAWGELPDPEQGAREFFGGDLPGIVSRLDYLSERLGVNALYLNPIFTAPSSHKYDVASYSEIDPHLGGEPAFLELRRQTRERGMKMILEIVPNHCGEQHPWFRSAVVDPAAETADFFTFSSYPEEYEAWLGIRSLPKLNYRSQKLRELMYEGPDAIIKRWLKPPFAIDGWRIDVANMLGRQGVHQLGHKVLRGIRRAVKSIDSTAYLLGESFFDASRFLQGDQLDGAMNYRGFMMPLYHWLTGRDYQAHLGRDWGDRHPLSSRDLETHWSNFRSVIPWLAARQQFNLLDSHDTPRLLHFVDGDVSKAAVARFLLFTYPGVPNLYYGDEVGLTGGRDPDNRRCMPWDESQWDHESLQGWTEMIGHRRELSALGEGVYQSLTFEQNTVAFLRESSEQRVIAVAKRAPDSVERVDSRAAAIPDGAVFCDLLSGRTSRTENGWLPVHQGSTQLWLSADVVAAS